VRYVQGMSRYLRALLVLAALAPLGVSAQAVCRNPTPSVTTVGLSAVAVPATPLDGRTQIVICNAAENATAATVKCRSDGANPTIGPGYVGDAIARGTCQPYFAGSGLPIKCISDTASTYVVGRECVSSAPLPDVPSPSSAGTGAVSGTVAVSSIPAISGTVAVSSIPAVSGTVTVSSLPAITGAVTGGKTNDSAAAGTDNVGALTAITSATDPTWTTGHLVAHSADLNGYVRSVVKGTVASYQGTPALIYDSGVVGSGAAILSGCIDTSKTDMLEIASLNSDASSDRYLTVYFYDTTTCTNQITAPYATSTKGSVTILVSIGRGSGSGASWTGVSNIYYGLKLPPGVKIGLGAAGSSNAHVWVW